MRERNARHRITRAALAAMLVTVATACADGDAPAAAGVRTDSAGIVIMEHRALDAATGTSFRLAATPSLVIGAEDGETGGELHRVRGARRLADGRIVVANGGASEIRVYAGEGALQAAFGRSGAGPGEFRNLTWLGVTAADSIVAYDSRLGRMSVFAPDGALGRSYSVKDESQRGPAPRPFGLLGDGSVMAAIMIFGASATAADGWRRDSLTFVRITRDGGTGEIPVRVAGEERIMRTAGGDFTTVTPPFARSYVAAAAADRFCAADSGRYEIACYSLEGDPQLILRVSGMQRAPTAADVTVRIAQVTGSFSDPRARQRFEQGMREVPLPEQMPAIARLLFDAAGRMWVMSYVAPRDTISTWMVFDTDGGLVGRMSAPLSLTVHEIGRDYVLGVHRDENDVEQVRLYDIEIVR